MFLPFSPRWPAPWKKFTAIARSPSTSTCRSERNFAANSRISRKWSAIWSTTAANGRARVAIEVLADPPASSSEKARVRIIVDDDGPGLSPAQREQVALRGQRLDETKPGSGLGLSIVVELAGLYGGVLTLGTAPIGGLRAELALPGE